MTAPQQSPRIAFEGIELPVVRTTPRAPTDAAPVIVLHGWGASYEAVRSIVAGLEDHAEVIALDLPGFGDAPPPPVPWAAGDYARFVLSMADQLGLERFSVVGHSNGARIALVLAGEHPDRIERLLLTGAAGLKPRRRPGYYARVAVAKLGRVAGALGGPPGRRVQERLRRRVASADWLAASETMRGTFRLLIAEDLTGRLARVAAPTLLIWGEDDADTPLWMGERMEQLIPDAGLVVLPGAGHFAYAERAGEFNRIAAHFLGRPSATAGGAATTDGA
jgi:pimeloyl-ACP methyl ester carboxylesterase